jgi:hypothetical protein
MYPQRSVNGPLILVLGILSLVSCWCITGIPAWVMGNTALREIDSGYGDPNERGIVQAGRILGIIATCLSIAAMCFYLLLVVAIGVAGSQARPH